MACWRCVICFVFVALTLKSLLSHINTAHSRNPDFRVICGIEGCTEEYRVFNSFYYHIRRTHRQYFQSGLPPTGLLRTASSDPSRFGSEHFDIPIFSSQSSLLRTSSQVNTSCCQTQMSQVSCQIGCTMKHINISSSIITIMPQGYSIYNPFY